MPVVFQDRITRAGIRQHPDRLYVFGDNLAGKGYGGLAAQCRGEPNAIGVPTKKAPSMTEGSFFTNADFDFWVEASRPGWDRIEKALADGKTVVFPKAELGSGLAQLGERAPRIKSAIESTLQVLQRIDAREQSLAQTATRKAASRR